MSSELGREGSCSGNSTYAIQAERLGKMFRLFDRPLDRLRHRVFGTPGPGMKEFWAFRGVDLTVQPGEIVAIVGRNGSGKSTLLQVIAGTLKPTEGGVVTRGRIAALLELGAGFVPELTGRENVLISGEILGFSTREIEERFDAIAEFAGIGDFIGRPVKTYSSGMYARLAFAVATCAEPDILIVDEALAVGDAAFQRKCLARINDLASAGTAVLFVSHATSLVIELCGRAILMDGGEILSDGPAKQVCDAYSKLIHAPPSSAVALRDEIRSRPGDLVTHKRSSADSYSAPSRQYGSNEPWFDAGLVSQSRLEYVPHGARIDNVRILTPAGQQVNVLISGEEYVYTYDVEFTCPAIGVRFSMLVKSTTGIEIGGMFSHPGGGRIAVVEPGKVAVKFRFRAALTPGTYFMNAGVLGSIRGAEAYLHRVIDALMFRIDPDHDGRATGYVDLSADPSCVVQFADRAEATDLDQSVANTVEVNA